MLARIRKATEEKDQGFTLIELLVVMIIIGILAAIAVPVFLNQRAKARDTATKADVSNVGKEIASYYVDGTGAVTVTIANRVATLAAGGTTLTTVNVSEGTVVPSANASSYTNTQTWCVALTNPDGGEGTETWRYQGNGGLSQGAC